MKKRSSWMIGVVAFSFPLASVLLSRPAHADLYHAVESGETLQSVASQYHLGADALRSLNKLQDLSDTAALPSMLLRIPDGKEKAPIIESSTRSRTVSNVGATTSVTATSVTTSSSASYAPRNATPIAAQDNTPGRGVITKSFLYAVQVGDTLESIASRHTAAGYPVTVQAIRSKNAGSDNLAVGRTLVIPVQSTTYTAPAPERSTSALRSLVSVDSSLPQVQQQPLFSTPMATQQLPSNPANNARRGPTVLSSRSYFPSADMTRGGSRLDGARIVGPNEDAAVTGTPLSKLRPRAGTVAPRATLSALAQVARISRTGARIRRLPEADAVTLYACDNGTEVAVTQQKGIWSAIFMSDGSTGWVPTRYLRFTGQSVDRSLLVTAAANTPDAELSSSDGRWQSGNPMVAQALTWLGTRYVYGGEGHNGIDCSSLVQHAFAACGYRLPRTAAEQERVGNAVDPSNLQAGDRLYFSASGTRVDHTGLYMGNGLFVHASGRGRQVMVSRLSDRHNWNIFVSARR